jgi:hypothetical protein
MRWRFWKTTEPTTNEALERALARERIVQAEQRRWVAAAQRTWPRP